MIAKLSLIVIRCADLARAVQFYSVFGIQFVRERHDSGPEHFSGKAGDTVIELYPIGKGSNTQGLRLGFHVLSLTTAVESLLSAGGILVSAPQFGPWGNRAVLSDPDGHKVELLEQGQTPLQTNVKPEP